MISVMVQNSLKKKTGEMKLEEAKKLRNVFKSNLPEIPRGTYKSEV